MNQVVCCLTALNQTPMDWEGNLIRIKSSIDHAEEWGAHFLCTPELSMTGYGCEDYFLRPDVHERAIQKAIELASYRPDIAIAVGLPFLFEHHLYNAMAILHRGEIQGLVPKTHLAREGIHYEPRWFRGWEEERLIYTEINGKSVPMGNLTFDLGGYLFGMEICEDAWVTDEQRPCRFFSNKRHAIFNASASHFALGKIDQRDRILENSSKTFELDYYYTNLLGCESGRAIYDGEMMVAENGQVIRRSNRLGLEESLVMPHQVRFTPRAEKKAIQLPPHSRKSCSIPPPEIKRSFPEKNSEFCAAASLGLFDYMRKSHSNGFTISLSGGVDSAVCTILAHATCTRMQALIQAQDKRLDYLNLRTGLTQNNQPDSHDPAKRKVSGKSISEQLITTVYQATRNSGEITREAASRLADHLGAKHLELDVDPIVESYKKLISDAIGKPLTWEQNDLALQNIQARSRGPSVWMLANLSGSLLLTTSNRSEVAVGYATMDGDTCGGLAPIAGVEKTFLRSWLLNLESEELPFCPAIPVLNLINQQDPTAELRPPKEHQADEKDLMPYEVLDALEEALVLRRETPVQAFNRIAKVFQTRWTESQLKNWTRRFAHLFAISQWKRERYAPSFHLDDRSLDPKTWARFPILSGNFRSEIEEL